MTEEQRRYSPKNLISLLHQSGLETSQFYSVRRDKVIMKVRAPLHTLQKEAFRIRYPLLLRKEMVKDQLQAGRMATHHWGPVEIVDEFAQTRIDPHEYMYGHLKGHMSHEDEREGEEAQGDADEVG